MRVHVLRLAGIAAGLLIAYGVFVGGYSAGEPRTGHPKTVIHVVIIEWKADTSDADKNKILTGAESMAKRIPGVRNVWMEGSRIQPNRFSTAFAIEFESSAAAEAYADNPIHESWTDQYNPLITDSISVEVTNP